jgi:hypothetical protein
MTATRSGTTHSAAAASRVTSSGGGCGSASSASSSRRRRSASSRAASASSNAWPSADAEEISSMNAKIASASVYRAGGSTPASSPAAASARQARRAPAR